MTDMKRLERAKNDLWHIAQTRGLSKESAILFRDLATRRADNDPLTQLGLEVCICLVFLDVLEGHTTTAFTRDSIDERFGDLSGGLCDIDEQPDSRSATLAEVLMKSASMLPTLTLAGHQIFSKLGDDTFQLSRLSELEQGLDGIIRERIATRSPISSSVVTPSAHLTDEQREAVFSGLENNLVVITGGPGTGKTSIIVELLRCAVALGTSPDQIALAAPTGKAGYRMGESILGTLSQQNDALSETIRDHLPVPMTLHRLLEYQPWNGRFSKHKQAPLRAELVIVDEMSMVDTELAFALFDALSPNARLVLLGDPGQLPSVGCGAVLRDLVEQLPVKVCTLTKSFRMNERDPAGSMVYNTSRNILDADEALLNLPCLAEVQSTWLEHPPEGVHCLLPNPDNIKAFLESWHSRFYTHKHWLDLDTIGTISADLNRKIETLAAAFRHAAKARILCPTRIGPFGSIALNQKLAQMTRTQFSGGQADAFCVGDLVMCTRNDYKLSLFNGDQGIVFQYGSEQHEKGTLHVAFEGDIESRIFPLAVVINLLEHAFAITVHKSQGSEFETIAIALSDGGQVSRSLLYTALTRAKREVMILGTPQNVFDAAKKVERRNTGINRQATMRANSSPKEIRKT